MYPTHIAIALIMDAIRDWSLPRRQYYAYVCTYMHVRSYVCVRAAVVYVASYILVTCNR